TPAAHLAVGGTRLHRRHQRPLGADRRRRARPAESAGRLSMYLTRFQINPARRNARKLLSSPQAMHAAVRAAFQDAADYERPGARTLWRIDTQATATVYL